MFSKSFAYLCMCMGIAYYFITPSTSLANDQVERTIHPIKYTLQWGLTKSPDTFQSKYLSLALLMLQYTSSYITRFVLFALACRQYTNLLCIELELLDDLPKEYTEEYQEAYFSSLSQQIGLLALASRVCTFITEYKLQAASYATRQTAFHPSILLQLTAGDLTL